MENVTIRLATAMLLLDDVRETLESLDPDLQAIVIETYRNMERELAEAIAKA